MSQLLWRRVAARETFTVQLCRRGGREGGEERKRRHRKERGGKIKDAGEGEDQKQQEERGRMDKLRKYYKRKQDRGRGKKDG